MLSLRQEYTQTRAVHGPGSQQCDFHHLTSLWGVFSFHLEVPSTFPPTDLEIAITEKKPKLHGVYCHFRRKKVFEKVYSGSQGKLSGRHLPFHQSVGDSHSCHKWLVSFDAKNNTIFLPKGL